MGKKTTIELEDEIRKLIKVNQSNFAVHQKGEMELRDIIRKKDKEINDSRTVIVKKDQTISTLEEQVLSLKFEEETDKAVVERLYGKIEARTNQIGLLTDEKEQLDNEYNDKLREYSLKVEKLKKENKDLERIHKMLYIENEAIKQLNSENESNVKQQQKKIIEFEMKCSKFEQEFNKNEAVQKQKKDLIDSMVKISDTNSKELKILQQKIQRVENEKNPNCKFGKFCRRLFCKFSHKFLFVKVNTIQKPEEANPKIPRRCENKGDTAMDFEDCAQTSETRNKVVNHTRNHGRIPIGYRSLASRANDDVVTEQSEFDNSESDEIDLSTDCSDSDDSVESLGNEESSENETGEE